MALFQGVFFLLLGAGLMLVAYQGITRGWLPFGPNGLKGRLEFNKGEQPFAFWVAFGLYMAAGLALTIYALRLLAGMGTPLPLR